MEGEKRVWLDRWPRGGIEIGMGVERRGPGARRTRCCTCREELIIRGFSNFNFRLWGQCQLASWDELCDIVTFCMVGYYITLFIYILKALASF